MGGLSSDPVTLVTATRRSPSLTHPSRVSVTAWRQLQYNYHEGCTIQADGSSQNGYAAEKLVSLVHSTPMAQTNDPSSNTGMRPVLRANANDVLSAK